MENNNTTTLGIETWGGGNRKQKRKASKLELVTEISRLKSTKSLDIMGLSIRELEHILSVAKTANTIIGEIPVGRFKKPYILALSGIFPTVSLDKLSVAALRELLGAFGNEK